MNMLYKSIHWRCSVKKVFLKNSQNSQENTCARVFQLWRRCFPVNFEKFLRTPFLQNTSGWLLLTIYSQSITTLNNDNNARYITLQENIWQLWRRCVFCRGTTIVSVFLKKLLHDLVWNFCENLDLVSTFLKTGAFDSFSLAAQNKSTRLKIKIPESTYILHHDT